MLPDVVISDVMMPRLDGYGLLKKLREDERLGGTPVIFLTAKGMTADRTQGYLAGVDDYIPKPFDPDELVARVRNVAQRQQRLLQEAARFADTDMGQMAKQITEIRSLLAQAEALPAKDPVVHSFTPREASVLQLVAEGLMNKEIARQLETSIRKCREVRQSPVQQDGHVQPNRTGALRPGTSVGQLRPTPVEDPQEGWLPAGFNNGWSYQDRVPAAQSGQRLITWMASRYRHSSLELWRSRLAAGQLRRNGERITADLRLTGGELITWVRPPWLEEAIPDAWDVIRDDGDILVINKPSGLPVMPGGGFLMHTLTSLLEQRSRAAGERHPPKPVHRLGRFASRAAGLRSDCSTQGIAVPSVSAGWWLPQGLSGMGASDSGIGDRTAHQREK